MRPPRRRTADGMEQKEDLTSPGKDEGPALKTRNLRNSASSAAPTASPSPAKSAPAKGASKGCESPCCVDVEPVCLAAAGDKCSTPGAALRWHHLSKHEHYCSYCVAHFTRRDCPANNRYQTWRSRWNNHSRSEPTLKKYVAEMVAPWWLRCNSCKRWRRLADRDPGPLNAAQIDAFCCGTGDIVAEGEKTTKTMVNPCSRPEELCASEALEEDWIVTLVVPALLQNSPAVIFITGGHYFLDFVGNSPTHNDPPCLSGDPLAHRRRHLLPFHLNESSHHPAAMVFRPDVMEYDELVEFSQYARSQFMYLGLRNLVIALWNLNPTRWLTPEYCQRFIVCRGLARIRCCAEVVHIVHFLTRKGVINFGLLPMPCPLKLTAPLLRDQKKLSVVVIGAGMSGLAAARQLAMHERVKVRVLEARPRLGGRICDKQVMEVDSGFVGLGAHVCTGLVNNPITVMAIQGNISYLELKETCPLLDETGTEIPMAADRRSDFHFNTLLDACNRWRAQCKDVDVSVESKYLEFHKLVCEKSNVKFSEVELRLLDFHRANLEYSCGTRLHRVSMQHWDQNDKYCQFMGPHAMISGGYGTMISRMAALLPEDSVVQECAVSQIRYSNVGVSVETSKGTYTCDKVLITVPLSVLKAQGPCANAAINFIPPLPQEKTEAIKLLGAGLIEKVIVHFPSRFWCKVVKSTTFFGHVADEPENRGKFSIFYDLSPCSAKSATASDPNQEGILMGYLSGDSVNVVREKSKEEVVDMFLDILKKMFPNEEIPTPLQSHVTNWGDDQYAGMAYSYVGVGATGEHIDALAKDVDRRLYFAGEATNRHFPQTVYGAYLSGVREAAKILSIPLAEK